MNVKIGKACTALATATILTGFGVVLFIQANLGSDTITVFLDGMRSTFRLSLGTASRIYNIGALLLALLLSRKDIGWTSIVYALSTGFVMDFFDPLLAGFQFASSSMVVRLGLVLIGQLCIVISFGLLIRFGSGMDQLDAISYGVTKRCPFPFAIVRTSLDIILLISGVLMGGVFGIGSIIAMATTGIGIDLFLKLTGANNTQEGVLHERTA